MRRIFPARPLALAALALSMTACARTARWAGDPGSPSRAYILIDNEANDVSEMTVTLVPEFGVPRYLGTVRNNERKVFVVRERVAGSQVQLLARPLGGREMLSLPFSLSAGDRFEWDMRMNSVFFRGRDVALR